MTCETKAMRESGAVDAGSYIRHECMVMDSSQRTLALRAYCREVIAICR